MEQKFIEMSKVIFTSIDHYRESGRDDKFNIDSIAEYLQRQFLLQQTPCTTLLEFLEQMLNEVSQYDRDGYLSAEMAIEDIKKGDAISYVIQMIKDCQPIA